MTRDLAVARTCRTLPLATLTTTIWLAATGWPWWLVALTAWPTPSLILIDIRCRHSQTRSSR